MVPALLSQCVHSWSQRISPRRSSAYTALLLASVHEAFAELGLHRPSQLAALTALIGDDLPDHMHFTGLGVASAVAEVVAVVRGMGCTHPHTHLLPPPPRHTHTHALQGAHPADQ